MEKCCGLTTAPVPYTSCTVWDGSRWKNWEWRAEFEAGKKEGSREKVFLVLYLFLTNPLYFKLSIY